MKREHEERGGGGKLETPITAENDTILNYREKDTPKRVRDRLRKKRVEI
jgi:hypothetical protein